MISKKNRKKVLFIEIMIFIGIFFAIYPFAKSEIENLTTKITHMNNVTINGSK